MDWRKKLAEKEGVPPFSIFHNATLVAIAEKRPKDATALREIEKVGADMAERFGKDVMEILEAA
tara:strand:+ start:10901 stop:11092 length:192 start_codon:yes stop_codon:yes gene_type:complete